MHEKPLLDVGALVAELGGDASFLPVLRKLRAARGVQSCLSDLRLAQDHIETLEHSLKVGGMSEVVQRRSIETALSTSAVLLYVRATDDDGRGSGRGSVKVTAKLSEDAKLAHKRLVKLRHTAIAHIDDGNAPPEYSWRETIIFGRWHGGWNLGVTTRQTTRSESVLSDLKLCLSEAEPLLAAKATKRINELTEALSVVPAEVFDRHTVEADKFFGGEALAAALLNSAPPGSDATIHVH